MLIAAEDFAACIDGKTHVLKAGEAFKGTKKAAEILKNQGLLANKPIKKEEKK